jgi:hypothetical protein
MGVSTRLFRTTGLGATSLAVVATGLWLVGSRRAEARQAPQYVGPGQCLNCHDHDRESQWYQKGEQAAVQKLFPDHGAQAGHLNSDKQLDDPKAKNYAAAIGLKDPYDVKGACVQCHGTVFSGDMNAGVSCEKCHGPASKYLTVHQTKGNYTAAVAAGMVDMQGKPEVWAKQCIGCHILTDDRLKKAGHRDGSDFDLSVRYPPVSGHFRTKTYSATEIAAVWNTLRPKPGAAAAPAPAPAPPTPAPAPAPAPPVAAPQPAAAAPATSPAAAPPTATRGGRAAAPPAAPAKPAPAPAVEAAPPATAPAPVVAPPTPAPPPPALPPSASLAEVQGRLIAALTALVSQGNKTPVRLQSAGRMVPYNGPDAALLELQQEAIALALQVLGQPPKAPGKSDQP